MLDISINLIILHLYIFKCSSYFHISYDKKDFFFIFIFQIARYIIFHIVILKKVVILLMGLHIQSILSKLYNCSNC